MFKDFSALIPAHSAHDLYDVRSTVGSYSVPLSDWSGDISLTNNKWAFGGQKQLLQGRIEQAFHTASRIEFGDGSLQTKKGPQNC